MKTIGLIGGMSWESTASMLSDSAQRLVKAGADCVLICTNTMHKVAEQVGAELPVPLMHIADATATQLKHDGVRPE